MENWGSARRQTLPGLLLLHCRFPGGVGPSSCSTYVWVSAAPLDRRRILPAGGGEAVLHKRCISSRINQEGRCRTPCVSVCGVSRWLLGDGGHPAVTHTHTHRCSACLPASKRTPCVRVQSHQQYWSPAQHWSTLGPSQ